MGGDPRVLKKEKKINHPSILPSHQRLCLLMQGEQLWHASASMKSSPLRAPLSPPYHLVISNGVGCGVCITFMNMQIDILYIHTHIMQGQPLPLSGPVPLGRGEIVFTIVHWAVLFAKSLKVEGCAQCPSPHLHHLLIHCDL